MSGSMPAPTFLSCACDSFHEINRREGLRGRACFPIQGAIQDEDFMAGRGGSDRLADAAEDEGGDERGVERPNTVDDSLGVAEGVEDAGVSRGPDLLAVGVDVPDAGDAGGEVLVSGGRFAEVEVFVAEGGEGAGEVVVFVGDGVGGVGGFVFGGCVLEVGGAAAVAVGEEEAGASAARARLEGGSLAWVGDGVLADDDGAVGEGGGDVVGEVGVDGWDDADEVGLDAADAS